MASEARDPNSDEIPNNNNMNHQQQFLELQPLLSSSSHLSNSSSSFLQQQRVIEEEEDVVINIKNMIQHCGDGLLLQECCIYRVPIAIRGLKQEAYTPKLVSVGPFHYGSESLQDMERHKQVLLKRFTQKSKSTLDDLVNLVKHLEPKVRASYSETINLTEHKLVTLILLDACFIVQLFIMSYEKQELPNDAKLSQPRFRATICEDLLLLENQLPFFVIEELFDKAFPNESRGSLPSFLELMYGYFGYFNSQELVPDNDVKIKHFTDLLRLFHLQRKMSKRRPFSLEFGSHILSYNVNALQEAGIKLKSGTSKCLLDLKFSGHVLEIPQIYLDDRSELVFRNMIALEQCLYPHDSYITDYAFVLDCLIDTDKDVELLVRKKIVGNFMLGDTNNVASLFNDLPRNVVLPTFNSEYLDICKKMNRYCEDWRHKLKATLKRDYCRTHWQIVASLAAILLLLLTIVQTIFSILQVVK